MSWERFIDEAGKTDPGNVDVFILISSGGGNLGQTLSISVYDVLPRSTPALTPICRKLFRLYDEDKRGQDLERMHGTHLPASLLFRRVGHPGATNSRHFGANRLQYTCHPILVVFP